MSSKCSGEQLTLDLGKYDAARALYKKAKKYMEEKFPFELSWALSIKLVRVSEELFARELYWVLRKKASRDKDDRFDPNKAVELALQSISDKGLDYFVDGLLQSGPMFFLHELPSMDEIACYHLARNIGYPTAIPDSRLKRVAKRLGFSGVFELCFYLAEETGDPVGAVDLTLWRYTGSRQYTKEARSGKKNN